jgi:hypothetical protein
VREIAARGGREKRKENKRERMRQGKNVVIVKYLEGWGKYYSFAPDRWHKWQSKHNKTYNNNKKTPILN